MCLIVVLVCRKIGPNLWYSSNFVGHGSLEQIELLERARKNSALSWGSKAELSFVPRPSNNHGWFVCLVISTGGRKGSEGDSTSIYAAHALHSLLGGLTPEEQQQVYAIAIVAHGANPLPHVLKQFHQVVEEPPDPSKAPFAKVKHAHATALEMCRSKSNLTLWIEDDVSSSRNVVNKLRHIVPRAVKFARGKEWLMVKLFYSDFWSGWSTETTPKFVVLTVITVFVGFGVVAMWLRVQRRSSECILIALMIGLASLFCVFWISFSLGRQNVFPDFAAGMNEYKGALAQALLYNNANVAEIESLKARLRNEGGWKQKRKEISFVFFLRKTKDGRNYDLVIDDWVADTKDKVAAIYWPCLFQVYCLSLSGVFVF